MGLCNQYRDRSLEEMETTLGHVESPGVPHEMSVGMPLLPTLLSRWQLCWAGGSIAQCGLRKVDLLPVKKHAHLQLSTQLPAVWPVDKQAAMKGTVFHVSCCSVNSHTALGFCFSSFSFSSSWFYQLLVYCLFQSTLWKK